MTGPFKTQAPVIEQTEQVRSEFLVKVYQHLALAVGLFVLLEWVLFTTGFAAWFSDLIFSGGNLGWLALLGGVGIVTAIAGRSANKLDNPGLQYISLFVIAAAQAAIFAPYLFLILSSDSGSSDLVTAAVITGAGFVGLSLVALITRKDLSFLRPIVTWGFGLALIAIVGGLIFGFNLGLWFSIAMVGISGVSILYQTQKIYRAYPAEAYVGAAVALFGSLMTLFWYVLRIVSSRN